jgi:hypothetical protein
MHCSSVRHVARIAAALAFAALSTRAAHAQARGAPSFAVGYTDIGPTIGIGGLHGANASIGGRMEHGFKALPDLGDGILGVEGSLDYYSWTSGAYNYHYVPLGVTLNYHVRLEEPRIDPFIGLGLGYSIRTCDFTGAGNDLCPNSEIYFIGRLGARYFFAPTMAAYADLGAGAATLNLGLMFKLK